MKLTNLLKSLYFLFCLVVLFSCQKENLLSKDEQFDSKPDIKTVFESQKKNYKDPKLVNEQLTFLDSLKEEILWDKAITFGDTSYIPVRYLLPANYRNGSGGQYLETEQWLMAIYRQKANIYVFNMLEVYRSDKPSKVFSGTILARNYFTKKYLSYANYQHGKFLKRDNKVASVGIVNEEDCVSVYQYPGLVTDKHELMSISSSQIVRTTNIPCPVGYKYALFRIGKISVGLPHPDEEESYSDFTSPVMKYQYRCIDCLGGNSVNPYDEFPTYLGGGGSTGGTGGAGEVESEKIAYGLGGKFGAEDDGKLSCKSFQFKPLSGTAQSQEAGISGLNFVIDYFDYSLKLKVYKVFRFRTMYVNLPLKRTNGDLIGPGKAAEIAAAAMNRAGKSLAIAYFGNTTKSTAATTVVVEKEFFDLVNLTLRQEGGYGAVSYSPNGKNTIVNQAVWNTSLDQLSNMLFGGGCAED